MLLRLLVAVLSVLVLSPVMAAKTIPTHEFKLDNGLKLLVREDHRAPVVDVQVWYKVGSSYEHNGITGVSHFLEHLMFKGTEKNPMGTMEKIITERGGRQNAFTSYDYTAYYQIIESSHLEKMLEMEADRMKNTNISHETLEIERKVVKEERRWRYEDNPMRMALEQFHSAAFISNPYRHPIIGWMKDIDEVPLSEVKRWYETWYAPNNATLVIVGDVQPEQVFQLVKKHFEVIPAQELPEVKPYSSSHAMGEHRVKLQLAAKVPKLYVGFDVPSANTAQEAWEPFALDVLMYILDGINSARLPARLMREQNVVAGVQSWYQTYARNDTLLTFSLDPAPGRTLQAVEEALLAEFQLLKNTPVSAKELERVKTNLLANKIYQQDSMHEQAYIMGMLESVGFSWQEADRYLEQIQQITPEQIQQVAQKYLVNARMTVTQLIPNQESALAKGAV